MEKGQVTSTATIEGVVKYEAFHQVIDELLNIYAKS